MTDKQEMTCWLTGMVSFVLCIAIIFAYCSLRIERFTSRGYTLKTLPGESYAQWVLLEDPNDDR